MFPIIITAVIFKNEMSAKSLIRSLRGKGLSVRPFHSGWTVELTEQVIPEELRERTLFINAPEGKSDDFSQVVCGLSGKRLAPYLVFHPNLQKGVDAWFAAPYKVITILRNVPGGMITVREANIHISDERVATVEENILFAGNSLTDSFSRFKDAAEATLKKSLSSERLLFYARENR